MNVLVIGGTRFMGYALVWRLLAAGHQVTILNRGRTPDPFGAQVERLVADRRSEGFAAALNGRSFDGAVDFIAYDEGDARQATDLLHDRVGHYLFISSGQVYLIREGCPVPSREADWEGPVMPAPADPGDLGEWRYGIGKREAELALEQAWAERGFPATRVRIPRVNGERDEKQKVQGYLRRILDGGPVLLPTDGNLSCRHVYADEVARFVTAVLGNTATFGQAYNLAQAEEPTLPELVATLADLLGAPDRTLPVTLAQLRAAGLEPGEVSPYSKFWSSRPDPSRVREELGFRHIPLREYLGRMIAHYLNGPVGEPPQGCRNRNLEVELARRK